MPKTTTADREKWRQRAVHVRDLLPQDTLNLLDDLAEAEARAVRAETFLTEAEKALDDARLRTGSQRIREIIDAYFGAKLRALAEPATGGKWIACDGCGRHLATVDGDPDGRESWMEPCPQCAPVPTAGEPQ